MITEETDRPGYRKVGEYVNIACDSCNYVHEQALLTEKGKLRVRDARTFDDHITAWAVAERKVDFTPGSLVAQVNMKRATREYWVYHMNDPHIPRIKLYGGASFSTYVEDRRNDILSGNVRSYYQWESMARQWITIEKNTSQLKLIDSFRSRSQAVSKALSAAQVFGSRQGYEMVAYEDINALGVTPPLADVQTYIADLVERHRNAKSVKDIHQGLAEITEVQQMLAVVDELEGELQSRLFGSLMDL